MASIYASAYLTIAATMSENAHGGLYGEPLLERRDHVHWFGSGDSVYPVYARKETYHSPFENSELPLLRRAWAFQERLLSPRVVHFADKELYWECLSETKCESGVYIPRKFSKIDFLNGDHFSNDKLGSEERSIQSSQYRWRLIVTRYCLRSLTYGREIFPAIQGIAKLFQSERGCAYYAGIWEDTFLYDLLWYHKEGTTKLVPYRAPSWSWASNYYPTDADGQAIESRNREMFWFANPPRRSMDTFKEKADVISVSTIPVGSDPLGEISSGTLKLKGRCLHAAEKLILVEAMDLMEKAIRGISDLEQPYCHSRGLSLQRTDDETSEILNITPPYGWHYDCSPNDDLIQNILLMEIVNDETWSASLALSPVDSERPDTFERVGMATIQQSLLKDAFQEWGEDMTLTII
jgi:hypothetical protein